MTVMIQCINYEYITSKNIKYQINDVFVDCHDLVIYNLTHKTRAMGSNPTWANTALCT